MMAKNINFTTIAANKEGNSNQKRELTLGFAGDICLAGADQQAPDFLSSFYQQSAQLTASVDLSIANLEFCITPQQEHYGQMSLSDIHCNQLKESGFDVFCLANNHIRDYGDKVLNHTKTFLHQQGFSLLGAGEDLDAASAALKLEIKGKKIGLLNVTDASHYSASQGNAGIAPLSKKRLRQAIKILRTEVELIIVCIHADLEFTNLPAPWKIKLSRYLIRLGADMVIHHHPHTLQGIEKYHGGVIAYSLGNFMFPIYDSEYMKNRPGQVEIAGFLTIKITFDEQGEKTLNYQLIPTKINKDHSLTILSGERELQIQQQLTDYSLALNEPQRLACHFHRRCRQEMKQFMLGIYYVWRKQGLKSMFDFIKVHISSAQHTHWIRGFFTLGRS